MTPFTAPMQCTCACKIHHNAYQASYQGGTYQGNTMECDRQELKEIKRQIKELQATTTASMMILLNSMVNVLEKLDATQEKQK